MSDTRRELILGTVSDLVTNLLYYDRRSDEQLILGSIEDAIAAGELTEADIVNKFAEELKKGVAGE